MNEDPMQPTIETYPFVISLDDSNNATLAEIGGAMYYNVETLNNGLDFIIIRVDETEFLALSSICTHQGCQVSLPTIDTPNIVCPCHMAEFSANNGAVIKQPSEGTATNLPVFRTEYIAMDNRLTVYLPGND
jgi:Rieske Fe-S protein